MRLLTQLGDRLLATMAPKADAAAVYCYIRQVSTNPPCYRRCCTGSGCGMVFC